MVRKPLSAVAKPPSGRPGVWGGFETGARAPSSTTERAIRWAVLVGSAEGFARPVGFFVAAVAACNCFD
jgi:hypothetical protein